LLARFVDEGRTSGVEVRVRVLKQRLRNCTLKVSAHIQAITELDADVEVVALIDADATPGPNWLRALIEPLADARVMAVNSNRWFMPKTPDWGSLVRRLWNAGSITQMYRFRFPWGGSVAFRSDLFRRYNLVERWRHCFSDDSGLADVLREHRLPLVYAPAATVINREYISFHDCFPWMHRQILCPRLDMKYWPGMLIANTAVFVALCTAIALLVVGVWNRNSAWIGWMGGLLVGYFLAMTAAVLTIDLALCRITNTSRRFLSALNFSWKLPLVFVLAHVVNFICFAMALTLKRVDWRGVTYAVDGPGRVQLVEYRQFCAVNEANAERSIL
jgi:cellulose synthase/poly-beta-1,6-N-acetylglucosamine synthase-like glycosyltransferase